MLENQQLTVYTPDFLTLSNYGERWRNEEAIATGFVESAVNQIVIKRFVKRQQMQWTKKSAHLVLQCALRCSMSAWKRPFVTGTLPDKT